MAGGERGAKTSGMLGFHGDDFHPRPQRLDHRGDTREETPAADRDDKCVKIGDLVQHFEGECPLAGHDVQIVEGMNEREAFSTR